MASKSQFFPVKPIPAQAGIGLRAEHYQEVLTTLPKIDWFEVHSENYFGEGGKPIYYLEKIRNDYPLSFHGVGLSLGSSDELDISHLEKLRKLINYFSPHFVSEHLCWSSIKGHYFNDLLPLPYTEEALVHIVKRINQTQEYLKRKILIENISSYLQFSHSAMPECEFLNEVAKRTECGILLDINNLYVNQINHGWDIENYLNTISVNYVKEIHLAGFSKKNIEGHTILIDTHNAPVAPEVWQLYKKTIQAFGKIPTLIEWDRDVPELDILLREASIANRILDNKNAIIA